MIRPALFLFVCGALALGACAKVGSLEQPAPLYGDQAKARYEAQKAAAARADRTPQTEPEALPPDSSIPEQEPPRTAPVPGESPGPLGAPPPGVLPNPYDQPQQPQ
jgi:hypothetical protein